MFSNAEVFNQDISLWNVGNGQNFSFMLLGADAMIADGWSETPTASDFIGKTYRN